MQFTVGQLLEQFSEDNLVTLAEIEQNLGVSDQPESLRYLQVAVDALERIGIIAREGNGYRRVPEEGLVSARLRCSSKGFCFAIQEGEGAEDVYIHESRLHGAWNGDRVLVRVTRDGVRKRSPEGEVRLVMERCTPTLLARVKYTEAGYRGVPLDDRLLFEVELVPSEEVPDLTRVIDQLVHVEIVRYQLGSHPPLGKILQVLGSDPENTNDIELVCCKYNLPRRFGAKEMSEAASMPRSVRKADLKHRVDLRELLTVRIANGPAVSVQRLETGWRLGIHIPDVAYYVTPESLLNATAQKRGRAFHVGETILPLLPEIGVLSQPEHLAMSLLIDLDTVGNILVYEIQPSVITLGASLSYRRAQFCIDRQLVNDLDDQAINQPIEPGVQALLDDLMALGRILPPLTFYATVPSTDVPEPDDAMWGIPVLPEGLPVAGVVCQVCILANSLIARHLQALGLPFPQVQQSAPEHNKLGDWLKLFASVSRRELEWGQTWTAGQLAELLQGLEAKDQRVLRHLLWKLWRLGEYSLGGGGHFGLGVGVYTHAVLPQYRYCDLLLQQLLHAVFEVVHDRRSSRSREGINYHSSTCHGLVQGCVLSAEAEKQWQTLVGQVIPLLNQQNSLHHRVISDLEGLRKAEVMRSYIGSTLYGLITGVQSYGFFVELEDFLVEGLVHVSSLKDDWYEFPTKGRYYHMLVGRRSGRQFGLGDRVEVQVRSVDYYRQQIDLGVVIPDAEGVVPEEVLDLPPDLAEEFGEEFIDSIDADG